MSKSRNKVHETASGVAAYRYVVFLGNLSKFSVMYYIKAQERRRVDTSL